MQMSKSNATLVVAGFLFTASMTCNGACAQVNNFFGANLPSADGSANLSPGQTMSPYENTSPQGSYTDDEKRMQKKFQISIKHARSTISKGEKMMAGKAPDSKEYKKGKIFKQIGEKQLAELESNNPLKKLAQDGVGAETGEKAQNQGNSGVQQ